MTNPNAPPDRVVLIDDHGLCRRGLAELTAQPPPIQAPLRAADRAAIDDLARQAGLAA